MPDSLPSAAHTALLAMLAILLVGCGPRHLMVERNRIVHVQVDVQGCEEGSDRVEIAVRPWHVEVPRGRRVQWNVSPNVAYLVIESKEPRWPFDWGQQPNQRARMRAANGQPIFAGPATGDPDTYSYRILVPCKGFVLDIDPEVEIVDPMR